MHILAITPMYPPVSLVGAWLATHEYLRHMVEQGHEVQVLAHCSRNSAWEHEGIQVSTMGIGKDRARRLASSADVVVSHCGDSGFAMNLTRDARRPAVRMVHGAGRVDVDDDVALLVFNSESLRNGSPHSCPSIVCHPVVRRDAVTTTPGDRITIVNCSADKGIKTAWRCADRLPDHQFLGVKGGHGFQETPRAVNFETIPTQQDMRAVYSRTRILLAPSRFETWGMVGVEAMCSGIPVVAHPTPGLLESLGDAGIFVDRADIDGWVREIERLDDPDEYATASAVALQRAAELDPAPDLDRFTTAVEALT